MSEMDKLAQVIRDLHGVDATHVRSEGVHEMFHGRTVWAGIVDIFSVRGHPMAGLVYAWSHETDAGGRRYVAVLGVPPVQSARDAVRASIAGDAQTRRKSSIEG
jgi:hypothetical protein